MRNDNTHLANTTTRAGLLMLAVALVALIAFVIYVAISGFETAEAQSPIDDRTYMSPVSSSGANAYVRDRGDADSSDSNASNAMDPAPTTGAMDNNTVNNRLPIAPVPDTGGSMDSDGTSTKMGTSPSAPALP